MGYPPQVKSGFFEQTSLKCSKAKFNTHEQDRTGLMYFNARYYDAEIGRFITADSVIPNPKLSQSFNRYMFVAGNPVSFVDSDGHSWWKKGLLGTVKRLCDGHAKDVWKNTKEDFKNGTYAKQVLGYAIGAAFIAGTIATGGLLAGTVFAGMGAFAATASWMTIGATLGFFIGGTKGDILNNTGDYYKFSTWKKNWNWGYAIAGAAAGAAVGWAGQYAATNASSINRFASDCGLKNFNIGGNFPANYKLPILNIKLLPGPLENSVSRALQWGGISLASGLVYGAVGSTVYAFSKVNENKEGENEHKIGDTQGSTYDSDGDGYADSDDHYPEDPTVWRR